jgi:heterogeneous nuclear ribonucleoprotein A1/A3
MVVSLIHDLPLLVGINSQPTGNGYGRNQGGGRWNQMNHDNNSGWNNNWNNDSYGDNSQWNNSPWDNGQGQWGNGNFNQNWSNDSFGSGGYQQSYGGGPQRGYSGNNRMVPYNNQSEFVESSKSHQF